MNMKRPTNRTNETTETEERVSPELERRIISFIRRHIQREQRRKVLRRRAIIARKEKKRMEQTEQMETMIDIVGSMCSF